MSTTDNELIELISQLLQMQDKHKELEAQQAQLKQQIATAVAKADDLRRKRTKGTDTVQE